MEGPRQPQTLGKLEAISGQPVVGARTLSSWIDGFMQYTKDLPSPEVFRRWGALACVAGALERKVWIWVPRIKDNLYPGMYTILAGPPGVGKTVVTSIVQHLWGKLPEHHLAPNSVSRASLLDSLREAERNLVMPHLNPSVIKFNSLLVVANELGVLVPGYDNDFMNTLTDVWNGKRYGEKKRGKDLNYVMMAPQINILAGTTPSYLNSMMPAGAWDQGFISRTLLIYSAESVNKDLFDGSDQDEKLLNSLTNDLRRIGGMFGKMKFTPDAAMAISEWDARNGPPKPDHPKLIHYTTRRTEHLLKLCMVASVAKREDYIINIDDYSEALSWLLDAEMHMPDIFKAMSIGGDAQVVEDVWYYTYQVYTRTKELIPEEKLVEFLANRVPAHSVERILQVMVKARLLEKELNAYRPRVRKPT